VMLGLVDLNAEIAACWKVSWNVDPAPLSLPLTLLLDGVDAGVVPGLPPDAGGALVVDEEHAAARRATATAPPTAATCFLPRSCISGFSLWV
jgi:hypothetical protein